MAYTPPVGNQLELSFTGRVYTPPGFSPDKRADALEMLFQRGVDIDYPVAPALRAQASTGWQQSSGIGLSTGTPWHDAVGADAMNSSLFGEATPLPVVDHVCGWDALPKKDRGASYPYGTPQKAQAETESPWANTRPTDPAPAPMPWDSSVRPTEGHTAALWGQPPTKDQHYAGPWFRVDTVGPVWNINDNRNPPLWADPPNALAFSFSMEEQQGAVYVPHKVPAVFFHFDGRIAPHPVQPKDASPTVRWQQSDTVDLSPDVLWGEGRFERIKDNKHTVDYGGKVIPLPLEPPAPDDKESYLLMNTVNALRLPNEEPLELLDISIDLDMDSFTWQLSAAVASRAVLALIEPDQNGTKDIKVTINGWDWVFMVTRYDTERSFGSERFRIAGESRTRLLAAPYAPLRSKTESNNISAVQAAEAELTNTGFTLTWDSTETWATPDWILPGGTFSYIDQTSMEVIAQIATTAGAIVIPAAAADELAIQPRYRISPWNWLEDTTPIDHAIPESMVLSMSVEWRPEPEYNAVYVSGINEGVAVEVKRQGSAGDKPAPDIIEDWLTEVDVNTERGRNVLSEGGNQAVVSLDLPLTVNGQEPGLVLPGQLVEVLEASSPWIGLCLSVGIRTAGSGAGKVVQAVVLERHFQEG